MKKFISFVIIFLLLFTTAPTAFAHNDSLCNYGDRADFVPDDARPLSDYPSLRQTTTKTKTKTNSLLAFLTKIYNFFNSFTGVYFATVIAFFFFGYLAEYLMKHEEYKFSFLWIPSIIIYGLCKIFLGLLPFALMLIFLDYDKPIENFIVAFLCYAVYMILWPISKKNEPPKGQRTPVHHAFIDVLCGSMLISSFFVAIFATTSALPFDDNELLLAVTLSVYVYLYAFLCGKYDNYLERKKENKK